MGIASGMKTSRCQWCVFLRVTHKIETQEPTGSSIEFQGHNWNPSSINSLLGGRSYKPVTNVHASLARNNATPRKVFIQARSLRSLFKTLTSINKRFAIIKTGVLLVVYYKSRSSWNFFFLLVAFRGFWAKLLKILLRSFMIKSLL